MDKKLTLQQVFTTAFRAFVIDRAKPSVTGTQDRFCAYRGKNNRRCILGLSIPDALYFPGLEGKGIGLMQCDENNDGSTETHMARALFKALFNESEFEALMDLQKIHDINSNEGEWRDGFSIENELVRFASRHGLTVPYPEVSNG